MPEAGKAFSGAGIDRVEERRADAGWVARQRADPSARALAIADGGVVVDGDSVLLPLAAAGDAGEPLLLGLDEGRPLFAVDVAGRDAGGRVVSVREAGAVLPRATGALVAYATALVEWHRRNRFCSFCGSPANIGAAGHTRVCPSCGTVHHPRTDPVVITLVTDQNRVLLGRQPTWPQGRYSALAGFVEPGETLEEAVAREVREEAGVDVEDPSYRGGQPWPFPRSLMLAFTARYTGGEPVAADAELEDVRWFTRDELVAATTGEGPFRVPEPVAIARMLIDGWLAGDY